MNIEPTEAEGTEQLPASEIEAYAALVSEEADKERAPSTKDEVFDPLSLPRLDPDVLQAEVNREVDADILRQVAREDLVARAAELANAPGFDWTKVPVTRPSQKQAKARKSKARQQRNARKHNRKK